MHVKDHILHPSVQIGYVVDKHIQWVVQKLDKKVINEFTGNSTKMMPIVKDQLLGEILAKQADQLCYQEEKITLLTICFN